MARRTKEEAQQTRCHIMSTALNLFCSHGLAKTSLTDIARAADLTRGADDADVDRRTHDYRPVPA